MYATIWQRIAAFIIDTLVFLPLLPLMFVVHSRAGLLSVSVVSALAYFAYQVGIHALYGQTLGKRVMRIRVIRIDGVKIGWRDAFLRSSVKLGIQVVSSIGFAMMLFAIPASTFPFASIDDRVENYKRFGPEWRTLWDYVSYGWEIINALTFFTNAQGRVLHDMIAGTVVVKVIDPGATEQ